MYKYMNSALANCAVQNVGGSGVQHGVFHITTKTFISIHEYIILIIAFLVSTSAPLPEAVEKKLYLCIKDRVLTWCLPVCICSYCHSLLCPPSADPTSGKQRQCTRTRRSSSSLDVSHTSRQSVLMVELCIEPWVQELDYIISLLYISQLTKFRVWLMSCHQ